MKLVSFIANRSPGFGIMRDGGVVDLTQEFAGAGVRSLRGLLAADMLSAARKAADKLPIQDAGGFALSPVIPDPDKIICTGLNYRDHVQETGRAVTERPALFGRYPGSQIAHGEPMVRPTVSQQLDFEGELAVVIGKPGRHIKAAAALGHVAGYSCYNDGSIRDWQRHTSQFLAGKTFAGTGAFGPWLVTADEVPDPAALTLQTRVNGQVMQDATTDMLITSIPALIEYCSTILPLLPGDVIVTGTPGGVGSRRTAPLWLKPGDVVEVEISSVGCLRNTVVQEAA